MRLIGEGITLSSEETCTLIGTLIERVNFTKSEIVFGGKRGLTSIVRSLRQCFVLLTPILSIEQSLKSIMATSASILAEEILLNLVGLCSSSLLAGAVVFEGNFLLSDYVLNLLEILKRKLTVVFELSKRQVRLFVRTIQLLSISKCLVSSMMRSGIGINFLTHHLTLTLEIFNDSILLCNLFAEVIDFVCQKFQLHLVSLQVSHRLAHAKFQVVVFTLQLIGF